MAALEWGILPIRSYCTGDRGMTVVVEVHICFYRCCAAAARFLESFAWEA